MDGAGRELHDLFQGRLRLYQPLRGYRFSVDAVLLAAFARRRCRGAVADLGTGCGVLPLLLAGAVRVAGVTGIEIQPELAAVARQNILHAPCAGKISIICGDLRSIKKLARAGSFDAVVTNPPFYRSGAGRVNPVAQKAAARHELHGTIRDFMAAASFLLKQGGRCAAVYGASRLADLLAAMREHRLEPKSLRFVHARVDGPAAMVLAEAVKGAGAELKIEPPLVLYAAAGEYSREALELFASL